VLENVLLKIGNAIQEWSDSHKVLTLDGYFYSISRVVYR
jgi:hypothetical protein